MKRKIRIVAATRRGPSAFRIPAAILLACCALVLFCGSVAAAQDQQPAAPAGQNQQPTASPAGRHRKEMPPMPAAPSEGKAIICIYRPGGAVGSAAHDHLYVNGVYLATLLNGEYAWVEVDPGTVVVTGMAKMYYGPSVIMSTAAAVNQTRGQAERIRLQAHGGENLLHEMVLWDVRLGHQGGVGRSGDGRQGDAQAASVKAREYGRRQGRYDYRAGARTPTSRAALTA